MTYHINLLLKIEFDSFFTNGGNLRSINILKIYLFIVGNHYTTDNVYSFNFFKMCVHVHMDHKITAH